MLLFFEDIEIGAVSTSPTFTVERDELIEFASRWDQLPIHLDDDAANAAYGQGGVTAPGVFVIAVTIRLSHQLPSGHFPAAVASFGYDEVRFHGPVRPGDELHLELEWISKRDSGSRPHCGIATLKNSLINQLDETVFSQLDTILVRRKNPPTE